MAVEIKSYEFKESNINAEKREFEGYASTWSEDLVGDVINRGAFTKSIQESFPKGRIKVLWQHMEPLGMPTEMYEDDKGLFVKGKISKTRLGDEAIELMKDGVIDSMSIGFRIPQNKSTYDQETGVRFINEVMLHEFSLVTFPANPEAIVTGVKSITESIRMGAKVNNAKDLQEALAELKTLIASIEPGSPTQAEIEPSELNSLLAEIKNLGAIART
jgi:HK97 family phage prohead protease